MPSGKEVPTLRTKPPPVAADIYAGSRTIVGRTSMTESAGPSMADKNLHVTQSVHGEAAVDEEPFGGMGKKLNQVPSLSSLSCPHHWTIRMTPYLSRHPIASLLPSPAPFRRPPSALITSLMLSDDPVSLRSPSLLAAKLET